MKNNKKIITVLVILLGLLVGILGLYFYISANSKSGIVDLKNFENKNDWQQYINKQYGFSFKYPKDFTLVDGVLIKIEGTSRERLAIFQKINKKSSINLFFEEQKPDINAKTDSISIVGEIKTEQVAVGTEMGILSMVDSNNVRYGYSGGWGYKVKIPLKDNGLEIAFLSTGDDTFFNNRVLISQILSTFEFVK